MTKKNIITVAIVLILVGAAAAMIVFRSKEPVRTAPAINNSRSQVRELPPESPLAQGEEVATTPSNPPTTTPKAQTQATTPTQGVFTGEEEVIGGDLQVFEVSYDGKQYTPKTVTVRAGDVVIFKNGATVPFWPASGSHPAHTAYPEFDPKKPVPAGGTFEFKFAKKGTWSFHDHLNPSAGGSIVVE